MEWMWSSSSIEVRHILSSKVTLVSVKSLAPHVGCTDRICSVGCLRREIDIVVLVLHELLAVDVAHKGCLCICKLKLLRRLHAC